MHARKSKRENMVEAVAGVIEKDRKVLILRRGVEEGFAHQWEFPGGKIEPGETNQDGVSRELREELGVDNLESFCVLVSTTMLTPQ